MASGDLTASTPTTITSSSSIKGVVDTLNLAAVTDTIHVVPISGRDECFAIFKVEREA